MALRKPLRIHNRLITATKVVLHIVSFSLVANLFYQATTDKIAGDPVDALLHFTGIGGLNLLMLTLLITPTAKLTRAANLVKLRRPIGLWAFTYAIVHFLCYVLFELQLEWQLIAQEILERPYITIGFTALLLLTALAASSPSRIRRKLGKHWQPLHQTIYLAVPLVVIHFYWSVKSELIEPIIYAVLVAILLYARRKAIQTIFISRKK